MAKAETNKKANQARTLPVSSRAQSTATDSWQATAPERYTKDLFEADLMIVSRRITDEINADPKEVERLRRARKEARQGKSLPWVKSDDDT